MIIYRIRIGNLLCEIAGDISTKTCVLMLPGFPGVPKDQSTLIKIANLGHTVIYPRYEGSWESDGVFLRNPPQETIISLLDNLNRSHIEFYAKKSLNFNFNKVILLGSSFGCWVCLNTLKQDHKLIQGALLISPLFSFKLLENQARPPREVISFTKEAYGLSYRFDDTQINRLLNDQLLVNSYPLVKEINKRLIFICGKEDNIIDHELLTTLISQTKHNLHLVNGNHVGFRHFDTDFYKLHLDELL